MGGIISDLEVRPCGWTELSGRFDRLSGMLILELHGAEVSQGRVQLSGVVDFLDEPGKVGSDVLERFVGGQVNSLDL